MAGLCFSVVDPSADMCVSSARSRDGLYEPALADSEREAVGDLLQYLENVSRQAALLPNRIEANLFQER